MIPLITQCHSHGACSTLFIRGLPDPCFKETDENYIKRFRRHVYDQLAYIGSPEHHKAHQELHTKRLALQRNGAPWQHLLPGTYCGPSYPAAAYAFLLASTNNEQPRAQKAFRAMGFEESSESYNSKNSTDVIIFMAPVRKLWDTLHEEFKETKSCAD